MKARFALVAFAAAIAVACSQTAPSAVAPRGVEGQSGFNVSPQGAPAPAGDNANVTAAKGQPQSGTAGGLGVIFDPNKVLVLSAQLQFRSADPWTIGDRVQQIAAGAGGDVVGVTQSGNGDNKSSMVTIRVPNDRFNGVLQQIKSLEGADLQDVRVSGEDKTADFVDLDARLKAKQEEEARYLALLAKADKVDDILKIDGVLSSVRTQIEQLQGQLNALKNRAAMATISVSITTLPLTPVTPDTGWQPQRTFQAAVAALSGALRTIADVAIWGLVWSWIPLLGLLLAFALARRSRSVAR